MKTTSLKNALFILFFTVLTAVLLLSNQDSGSSLLAQEIDSDGQAEGAMTEVMRRFLADQEPPLTNLTPTLATPCVAGMAGIYPCEEIDLLAHIPLASMSATAGNDSWGWTDSLDGKEYALMGVNNGTAFVDISDPENPVYLGKLPTQTSNSSWRDIKVYADYAFVVSEASGHGMQVFDLTLLRNVVNPPVTFSNSAHYNGFGNAHNLVINEDSGYAYAVGTGTCSGGLHMVNIQNPLVPTNAGCFSADGYTHDAQCVIYNGPDSTYEGHEICFNSNEDSVTIVDVTNKSAPVQLFRLTYSGSAYTHQGWLTEDHRHFLFDDELDEQNFGHNTRTRVVNVSDLNAPTLVGFYDSPVAAIDHNLYNKGSYAFQANYRSGLRVVDITNVASASLSQVSYFDTYPASNSASFSGAWSNYPYFDSGVVIISDINSGLFIVQPWYMLDLFAAQTSQYAQPGETVTYTVDIHNTGTHTDTYALTFSGNQWVTAVSTDTISLAAGASDTFEATVTVPAVITANTDNVTISAVSQSDNAIHDAISLQTTVIDYAVALSAAEDAQSALPGTTVTYTLHLTNTGNISDNYDLSAAGNSWETTFSEEEVQLEAGASAVILAGVHIPIDAPPGTMDMVTVTAVSQADASTSAATALTTTAETSYGVAVAAPVTEQSGVPGSTVAFTLHITNTGNTTDTFDLQAMGNWPSQAIPTSLVLASNTSSTAQVTVTIPLTAAVASSDVLTVTVTSQGDDAVFEWVLLTAVAVDVPPTLDYAIYLPIITKLDE